MALLAAPLPTRGPAPAARPPQPRHPPVATSPAHSAVALVEGDARRIVWQPGHSCPPALQQAAERHTDATASLSPADDEALPLLQRLAHEAQHALQIDEAVWAHLAAHRDARHRLSALESAYPQGPASPTLQRLLRVALPLYQAEGALFAVVAGRALIADERGLGKSVQAIAAARLWQQHFGVQRVLVLCAASQRHAWQRAWQRFAGPDLALVIDGGLHQRQALWSASADVRILSPETLQRDTAQLAFWAPELIIVDEPQQLALQAQDWQQLDAPHALVLCGAALAEQPALMEAIISWLDLQRLGPLAALRELMVASDSGRALDEVVVERLTSGLSRLMLQRQRAELSDQLPALVHSERLAALAPGQRDWHERHAAEARRLLAGWQRSGYCSDSDQWRLALALREMQRACQRAEPANPHSVLAEATLQALAAQLDDWSHSGPLQVAVLCASKADQAQLAERLAEWLPPAAQPASELQLRLLGPDQPWPNGLDALLQIGVPWQPRGQPAGARGEAPVGQQWVYVAAQDSIECGLFDTLAQRLDVPRGLADGGGRDYLQGAQLSAWLSALWAALMASAPAPG